MPGIIQEIFNIVERVLKKYGIHMTPSQTYDARQKTQRALTMTFGAMELMKAAELADVDDLESRDLISQVRSDLQKAQKRLMAVLKKQTDEQFFKGKDQPDDELLLRK